MDMHTKRPLEVRVRNAKDGEGFTEASANAFGRMTADALVLMRGLVDEGTLKLQVTGAQGPNGDPIGPEAMFYFWLTYTGVIARLSTEGQSAELTAQIVFVRKMLMMMGMDETLGAIANALAKVGPTVEPASSTLAEPSSPQGADPTSLD